MPAEDVGKIAYCLTAGGASPGVVTQWRGERAKVLVHGEGRETWTEDRIFWVSDARAPMHSAKAAVEALTAFHERVEEAMTAVDLAALWDLLAPDGGSHYPDDLATILFSEPGPEHACAVACVLALDRTYFHGVPGGAWSPCSPESVDQAIARRKREQREAALVENAVKGLRSALDEPLDPFDPDQTRGVAWLKALAVHGPKGREGAFGVRVLEGMEGGRVSNPQAGALDLLIRLGVFHEDEILGVHVNHIRTVFPREVLEDAAAIAARVLEDPQVACRRAIAPTGGSSGPLAIDDPWTTEVDDALMVEDLSPGTRVHVLIADPGAGVSLDSPTAIEGMSRAATLYLPTGKVPMLPPILSEGALSLNEGEIRPVIDLVCDLGVDGEVRDFALEPALCRVEHHLTYDEADRLMLEYGPDSGAVASDLRILDDLAVKLRGRREAAGALILARDDVSVRVEHGEVVVRRLPWSSPARRLVSEFMVLACTLAGRFARDNGIPAVYRRQDPPDDPDAAAGFEPGSRQFFFRMVRSMRRAVITTQPDFHYGMGVVGYTQVTSPLRRFQDLLVQAQLKGFLKDGRAPLDTDSLLRVFGDLENRGDAVIRTEREARRYYLLKALSRSVGAEEPGEVLAVQGSRAIIELDRFGLEAPVPGGGRLKPGARVRVNVVDVDPRLDRVSLRLA